MKLVVFGDSILKGVITIPNSDKLFDVTENDSLSLAQKELGFELDNRSIYGNITSKGLVKLQKFFEKGGEADFCIIEFGSNDCDYDWGTLVQKVPLAEYLENLSAMVKLCRDNKVTPLMMGLIPYVCDDWFKTIIKGQDQVAILNFLGGTAETLGKNQLIYKNAQADFVQKNKVQFLDPWTIFEGHKEFMCYDGIHPNEEGYKLLSQAWIKFLSEVKKEF
ncbi:SGNH/GDSL hydrolase family protein [Treponema bryantii]|uniref:SGNH/GDSL hydrolase family protein n=1 Tax=Treponema bryantii TaxID=163 RepID=UPI0003B6A56B|nr:SGNH/GDSL hydrolase family protein [Treponema bryantii]